MSRRRISVGEEEFFTFLDSMRELSSTLSGMTDIMRASLILDPPNEVLRVLAGGVVTIHRAAANLSALTASMKTEEEFR